MLSTFSENFQRLRDVEQFAIDNLEYKIKQNVAPDKLYGEAELHCQGYAGEGKPPADVVLACKITITKGGHRRFTFKLNGKRIACSSITLQLGALGV